MQRILRYIDRVLIDEYATKTPDGYELDIDELPAHEFSTYLDQLMTNDEGFRDFVKYEMQKALQARLAEKFIDDRISDERYSSRIDSQTGETIWEPRSGYAF